ncbi:tRNA 2-thiouridine(34) synthase MnmA [uncultured Oscillibacter sp.]|uniref:tRNA 2-thiouridine(34) synthase MnmA n=1 Tax=uncultured Oscillibacter sp. TaxID=876091 RepID=UPI00263009A9|nr:tRNA 2-thiouridine(34) synthase MnmA [uncultured Oscillibacter sp.]
MDIDVKEKGALIAMSGGVDSTVAAYLMLKADYRCLGVNMCLRPEEDGCTRRDAEDASGAAAQLGIPCEVLSCTQDFQRQVIDKFIRVYEEGGTPNPCVDCNRCLKFGRLLQEAEARGLDFVVTGHYARIQYDEDRGRWLLKKALDAGKDQSYVLYMLTQEQLAHIQFPLGGMEKRQVRALAETLGLANAGRHDSQDICFVPDGDYAAFMERASGRTYPAGDFLDRTGRVVGRHRGAVRYTLGQRKGLGLAMGAPVYVCGKDMARNTVTVGPEEALYSRFVRVERLNWISIPEPEDCVRVQAKLRYRQREQWAVIRPAKDGTVVLEFDTPQRAVTPGQAAVFYDGDLVVGGGTIVSAWNREEEAAK